MRKFLIPALLLASIAAPAAAQYHGGHDGRRGGLGIERQIDQIERQIDRLRDRRLISSSEAHRLSRRAEQIDRLHDRYRRNGLSRREHGDLQRRIHDLRQRVQYERREGREDRRDRW
jgi:hypothetical protein